MGQTLSIIAFILCSVPFSVSLSSVTFTKDTVAPILQQHCQTCHRPGEAAPFPLLTYDQARPWASTMKRVVQQKVMPPWFAGPQRRTLRQRPLAFRKSRNSNHPGLGQCRRTAG